jgi:hypothetical protein
MGFDWETFTAEDGNLAMRQGPCQDCKKLREVLWAIDELFGKIALEAAEEGYSFLDHMTEEITDEWIKAQDKLNKILEEVKRHYIDPWHAVEDLPAKKEHLKVWILHISDYNGGSYTEIFRKRMSKTATMEFIDKTYGPHQDFPFVWRGYDVIDN